MKNALYVRVSTREQKEEGHSIEGQIALLKAYCKNKNINNLKIYNDEGYTAYNENRPMYKKLIKDVISGKIDNVIVKTFDRISRNSKDFILLCDEFDKYGTEVISTKEEFSNNAIGKFGKRMAVMIGELEIGQISERTIDGIQGGFEKNLYPIGGKLPLGISRREDRGIEYNEDSEIVKEMFILNKEGYAFTDIKNIIEEKYSKSFAKNTIENIIKNTLYQGFKIYRGRKYTPIEPLFDASDIFELIENKDNVEVVKKNKRIKYKHEYKFNGKIVYKDLNNIMYAQTARKKLKTTGEIREYKYYVSSDRKVKINQEYFIQMLNDYIKIDEKTIVRKIDIQLAKLKDLYIMGDIDKEEYKRTRKSIKMQQNDISQYRFEDKNIKIDSNYDITVSIKKQEYKFNYKEEMGK